MFYNGDVVKITEKNLYQCEECGFHYEDKELAEKCEAFCKENSACNIEIIRHAVEQRGTSEF